jgi:hypothetical protein
MEKQAAAQQVVKVQVKEPAHHPSNKTSVHDHQNSLVEQKSSNELKK